MYKQKYTTCDETEDNDECDEPPLPATKVRYTKKSESSNYQQQQLDFNALVRSCLDVTPPDLLQSQKEQVADPVHYEESQNFSEQAFGNCFPDAPTVNTQCTEEFQEIQSIPTQVAHSSNFSQLLNQFEVVQLHEPQVSDDKWTKLSKDIENMKDTLLFLADGQARIQKNVDTLMEVLYRPIVDGINGSNLFPFPIKSIQELKEFNHKLGEDEHFFNQIVSKSLV